MPSMQSHTNLSSSLHQQIQTRFISRDPSPNTQIQFPPHQPPVPNPHKPCNIKETKDQTPTKHKALMRPRIPRIQLQNLTDDRPRQHVEQIARQALVEVPRWLRREQKRRELRRGSVADVAGVDCAPHVCRYVCDSRGGAEPERVRTTTKEGEEDCQGDFDCEC